jgi:hypothetical protein
MGFVVKRPSRIQEQFLFFIFGQDGHLFSGGLEKIRAGAEISRGGLPPARI